MSFEQNRNEIIRSAYENCRVAIDGEELTAEQMQKGARTLNALIKHWQAQGFHMWKLAEGWLFPKIGQAKYMLGTGGDLTALNVKENVTVEAAQEDDDEIILDTTKGMPEAGDNIVIKTSINNLFYSTVVSVNDDEVTISDTLPEDVASGAVVYFFNQGTGRPLKILQARRYVLGGSEIEMVNLENAEYFRLPQKEQRGTPTSWTYVPTLDKGTFYLWNTPALNNLIIKFTYEQDFDILEDSKDVPDIAAEWILPLQLELAYRLSDYCGLDLNERGYLKQQAAEALAQARNFDQETGGFQIAPNYRGY